jgi:hypothetical protein
VLVAAASASPYGAQCGSTAVASRSCTSLGMSAAATCPRPLSAAQQPRLLAQEAEAITAANTSAA